MNTKCLSALTVTLFSVLFAEAKVMTDHEVSSPAKRNAAVQKAIFKKTGGFVTQPNSSKGKIILVDAQLTFANSNFTAVVDRLVQQTRFNIVNIRSATTDPRKLMQENQADVAVLAIENQHSPVLTVAPEEHWAIVNVSRISEGLKTEEARIKFASSRFRKEILKAYTYAAGGGSSQFPDNIMSAKSIPELDMCSEMLPVDSLGKASTHLKRMGLSPANVTTYHKACLEGWAPPPTNDIQKAIWNQVHEIPTDPIKIKFDPKTDTK